MWDSLLEFWLAPWWEYRPETISPGYQAYHLFNLLEGGIWCVFGLLVLIRYAKHRSSGLEIVYGLTFFLFAATDFWEAYLLQLWLIPVKVLCVIALLWMRFVLIRTYYPQSNTY